MTEIISQIWNGHPGVIERFGRNNPDMREPEDKMCKYLEKYESILDNAMQKKLFEECRDAINDYIDVSNEEAFCDGFCLAVKLLTEALNRSEQIEL